MWAARSSDLVPWRMNKLLDDREGKNKTFCIKPGRAGHRLYGSARIIGGWTTHIQSN